MHGCVWLRIIFYDGQPGKTDFETIGQSVSKVQSNSIYQVTDQTASQVNDH